MYLVYILECADGTLYTGITTDVERRVYEHNNEPSGAKYTRVRRPVRLVYHQECENRSEALKKEAKIKKLSREAKLDVIRKHR